jgi:hypothetical protein
MPAPLLTLGLILATGGAAQAAEPGHYHPDTVAAKSARFTEAAKLMGPSFDAAQQQLTRLGRAVEALDGAVLLLGDRAPEPLTAWAVTARKRLAGGYLSVQRHVDLVQEDFGEQFGGALERAVAAEGEAYDLKECGATGIAAMMGGRSQCEGADRNASLAARLDADPELASFTDELKTIPWPSVEVSARTAAPIPLTGSARWVSADAVLAAHARGALSRRADDLEESLDPLIDRIEAGDAEAVAEGQAARDRYGAALARDGAVLWESMTITLERAQRRGGPEAVGVCPVPVALGGCEGEDATPVVLETLAADRRFLKSVSGLRSTD